MLLEDNHLREILLLCRLDAELEVPLKTCTQRQETFIRGWGPGSSEVPHSRGSTSTGSTVIGTMVFYRS